MKMLATIAFVLPFVLLSTLLDWADTTVSTELIVDTEIEGYHAASEPPLSYPLVCDQAEAYTIQVVWTYTNAATIPPNVVAQVTPILERVNGLFFRDGGTKTARLPRWRMGPDCQLLVMYLPLGVDPDMAPLTKYMLIEPDDNYCGMATAYLDDSQANNLNNQSSLSWISTSCLSYYVVAHEFIHSVGGVQPGSPHSDGRFHAIDFGDVMARPILVLCPHHDTVDCNGDDYFAESPPPGSYLDTHWNIWHSPYLVEVPKFIQYVPIMLLESSYAS